MNSTIRGSSKLSQAPDPMEDVSLIGARLFLFVDSLGLGLPAKSAARCSRDANGLDRRHFVRGDSKNGRVGEVILFVAIRGLSVAWRPGWSRLVLLSQQ